MIWYTTDAEARRRARTREVIAVVSPACRLRWGDARNPRSPARLETKQVSISELDPIGRVSGDSLSYPVTGEEQQSLAFGIGAVIHDLANDASHTAPGVVYHAHAEDLDGNVWRCNVLQRHRGS